MLMFCNQTKGKLVLKKINEKYIIGKNGYLINYSERKRMKANTKKVLYISLSETCRERGRKRKDDKKRIVKLLGATEREGKSNKKCFLHKSSQLQANHR